MPNQEQKGFYISTAIVYPNSRMHVGFGWEVLSADMVARYWRMTNRPVFFSTGADEHSQNVEKAALKNGLSPKVYCDQMSQDITKVMKMMDIAYDRYIRTSDKDHENVCRYLIEKSKLSGDIYKQEYEGLYCDGCEVFYTEKEALTGETLISLGLQSRVQKDSIYYCANHKLPLRKTKEENYFFKLSKYEDDLKKLYLDNPDFLQPQVRKNEVLSFLENGLKDFSVSRTSFKWGIPIPFDLSHIIYVWFDALINYLSAVKFPIKDSHEKVIQGDESFFKKFWPCDIHVIGKDITRFHCLYWPAMLLSTGIDLPKKVWAHGFIQLSGEKMSKSIGNIITPDDVINLYGVSALRWYLLVGNAFENDGNYSDELLIAKCNGDLSNNLGNLINRTLSMAIKSFGLEPIVDHRILPDSVESVESRMTNLAGANGEKFKTDIETMNLSGYGERILLISMSMNKFIDECKPWSLGKILTQNSADAQTIENTKRVLSSILFQCIEGIRNLGIIISPILPQASLKILTQLGINPETEPGQFTKHVLDQGDEIIVPKLEYFGFNKKTKYNLKTPEPIFPRLEMAKGSASESVKL